MTNFSAIVKYTGKDANFCSGFLRGGNWNNGANTGSFTLNLNNTPSNTNTNIGFRCTSDQKSSLVQIGLHQNERYISKDLCPGFRRSQYSFRFKGSLWENIIPVFLYVFYKKSYRVNRSTIALVRDNMSPFVKRRAH